MAEIITNHQIENTPYLNVAYFKQNTALCPWPLEVSKAWPVFRDGECRVDNFFRVLDRFFERDNRYHRDTRGYTVPGKRPVDLKDWFDNCQTFYLWHRSQAIRQGQSDAKWVQNIVFSPDHQRHLDQLFNDLVFFELKVWLYTQYQMFNTPLLWNGYNGSASLLEQILRYYQYPGVVDVINHSHTGRDPGTPGNTYGGGWNQQDRFNNTVYEYYPVTDPQHSYTRILHGSTPTDRYSRPFVQKMLGKDAALARYYQQMYGCTTGWYYKLDEPILFTQLRNRILASQGADWDALARDYAGWQTAWTTDDFTHPVAKPTDLFQEVTRRTLARLEENYHRMNARFPQDPPFRALAGAVTPADIRAQYLRFMEKVRNNTSRTIYTTDNAYFYETLRTLKEMEQTLFVPEIFLCSLLSGDETSAQYGFIPTGRKTYQIFPCVISYLGFKRPEVENYLKSLAKLTIDGLDDPAWRQRGQVLKGVERKFDIPIQNLSRATGHQFPHGNLVVSCYDTGHGNMTVVRDRTTQDFVVHDCGFLNADPTRMKAGMARFARAIGQDIDWTHCRAILISHHHQDHINLFPLIQKAMVNQGCNPADVLVDASTAPVKPGWRNGSFTLAKVVKLAHGDIPCYAYGYKFGGETVFFQADGLITNPLDLLTPGNQPYQNYFLDASFDLARVVTQLQNHQTTAQALGTLINHASMEDVVTWMDYIYDHGGTRANIYLGGISGVAEFNGQHDTADLIRCLYILKTRYGMPGMAFNILTSFTMQQTIDYTTVWYLRNALKSPPAPGKPVAQPNSDKDNQNNV